MARKKAKNSTSNGILIIFALAFVAVAPIPKNAWIAIGVIACIAAVFWLLVRRSRRQAEQLSVAVSETEHLREHQRSGLTFSIREVSGSQMGTEETSDFFTLSNSAQHLQSPSKFQMRARKNLMFAGYQQVNLSPFPIFQFPVACSIWAVC